MSEQQTDNKPEVSLEVPYSQKFTDKVMLEFGTLTNSEIEVTEYQRNIIKGYFIGIDRALKTAEVNRLAKNDNNKDHKYDNPLACTWSNVNLEDLAKDVMYNSKIGLDMSVKNHLSPIPYRNKKTGKYDVNLMEGYAGIEYKAKRYAVNPPIDSVVELVRTNDKFAIVKRDSNNPVEYYTFVIDNPFDRGDIVGGFGYLIHEHPEHNKVKVMTVADIEKRKPTHAAAEFWGGTKKVWEKGKQVSVETDGWKEEMYLKTIKREIFGTKNVAIDPLKIDDAYRYMKARETQYYSAVNGDLLLDTLEDTQATAEKVQEEAPIVDIPDES